MNRCVLGIDLGTSSVKLMLLRSDGSAETQRAGYDEISVAGWQNAIEKAAAKMDLSCVTGVGLSSQVGTYIINDKFIIPWNIFAAAEELNEIKNKYAEYFLDEISMPHPDIMSYPIPRLLYIKRHYDCIESVCQPKDKIVELLTGRKVTDKYSWRGLANMYNSAYSSFFLERLGISEKTLPAICGSFSCCGVVNNNALGIPTGTPVYTGLNDFYASVVGMGITEPGQVFDITGTSEHIGIVGEALDCDTPLVSSEYFGKYVTYGVTASSGAALDFAINCFGLEGVSTALAGNAPIFTPYLNGERAPIFDSSASGCYFGITGRTTKSQLAYSVLEGVAFSIYHIYEVLGASTPESISVSGGASKNDILNSIKATLFGTKVITLKNSDTSALGACIAAMLGSGEYPDIASAAKAFVQTDRVYTPEGDRELLLRRYKVYKSIYPSLKESYKLFKEAEI